MARKHKNEDIGNDLHECKAQKFKLEYKESSLKDCGLSSEEIVLIWDFFVSHAPVCKNHDNKGDGFGLRYLGAYGWTGNADHNALERKLLAEANLGRFVMIRAEKITDTLSLMNLQDEICWEHPRAVLKQNYSITVHENGSVSIENSETRMICLFRHIRNSLAHNRIYFSPDGDKILLEDADDKGITARILIPVSCLLNWITIIDKNKVFYPPSNNVQATEKEQTKEAS